jgi:hypothetical protein
MGYLIKFSQMLMTRGSLLGRDPSGTVVHVGLDCSRGMERTVQVLAAHSV